MSADDSKNDLVLLKLKGKDLPFLPLGNSDNIGVGMYKFWASRIQPDNHAYHD